MPYPKTEPKVDFPKLEQGVMEFWRDNGTFKKSIDNTRTGAPFSFYDGPPFANALPHLGHMGVSAMKDLVARFWTMRGRRVDRVLGWDCHGLPAENSVEKKRGKMAKDIVAENGMADFCDACRADIMTYSNEWRAFIARIGRWVDADGGYRTMDKNFMESVMWTIKELHNKGLLYKDYRVNPYDWKLGTVLSNSEASQDYRVVQDEAISVWFELEDGRRIIAWTTTPWTLPANEALAVNPKMEYVQLRAEDGKNYVVAKSRAGAYEKQLGTNITANFTGDALVGKKYKPLFAYYNDEKLYHIAAGEFVSDSDGTGIVHLAPAFGEDDFWTLKKSDQHFPVIVNVDDFGNFTAEVLGFSGMNIFEASPKIIENLKKCGNLIRRESYSHSYPYGDRSKEKLIYRATDSWYIDVPKIHDALLKNNEQVRWTSAGARFADWIKNARPWSISRNRFWGTPLPIWERDGEYKIFGSIAEIEKFFDTKIEDLHRPTLDALEKDGWHRIPDVLDCWVESGSMPWASLHYPFENKARFDKEFPADYIIEGQDQTRGWFYSLMVLASALFSKPAFKAVSANGMVVDDKKKKLSKSVGNYSDPMDLINTYGADAVRLYILGSNFLKAEPVSIDLKGLVFLEPTKTILVPLWNAYHFFTLYANAGNMTAGRGSGNNVMDKYILSELNDLTAVANDSLENYSPDLLTRKVVEFLDILNNWYVRLNRERFWNEDQDAFNTLWTALSDLCRIIAPVAPFLAEHIFRALNNGASVHLENFPTYIENKETESLRTMRTIRDIVSVGKMLRENAGLRNRLPLNELKIYGYKDFDNHFIKIIETELNVKKVSPMGTDSSSVAESFVYLITPKIGARLGAKLKEIMSASKQPNFNPAEFGLLPDEFEMRLNVKAGITGAALPDNTAVVVLDTDITPELVAEGLARDVLRFVQDTRKAMDLDVSDRITLEYDADDELSAAIEAHSVMIKENALATELRRTTGQGDYSTEIESHKISIRINK
ncbi:MAG: isoleucine--tRNA ligase [Rickettsiales bacterium]|jgi:isoleucyl-tRNA synthetase|nr:isoleucine--tRNA ligase [Rickettsiales bacterium]